MAKEKKIFREVTKFYIEDKWVTLYVECSDDTVIGEIEKKINRVAFAESFLARLKDFYGSQKESELNGKEEN